MVSLLVTVLAVHTASRRRALAMRDDVNRQ